MKSIIVASALIVTISLGAYKVHKLSAHNAYVAGCSSVAKEFLAMLNVVAPEDQIVDMCSTAATQEGY